MLALLMTEGKLRSWPDVERKLNKREKRCYDVMRPWLMKEHPGMYERISEQFKAIRDAESSEGGVMRILPSMSEVFKNEI